MKNDNTATTTTTTTTPTTTTASVDDDVKVVSAAAESRLTAPDRSAALAASPAASPAALPAAAAAAAEEEEEEEVLINGPHMSDVNKNEPQLGKGKEEEGEDMTPKQFRAARRRSMQELRMTVINTLYVDSAESEAIKDMARLTNIYFIEHQMVRQQPTQRLRRNSEQLPEPDEAQLAQMYQQHRRRTKSLPHVLNDIIPAGGAIVEPPPPQQQQQQQHEQPQQRQGNLEKLVAEDGPVAVSLASGEEEGRERSPVRSRSFGRLRKSLRRIKDRLIRGTASPSRSDEGGLNEEQKKLPQRQEVVGSRAHPGAAKVMVDAKNTPAVQQQQQQQTRHEIARVISFV